MLNAWLLRRRGVGQWSSWTGCSLSCGGGVNATYTYSFGPWLAWSQWSECTVSCGGGQQSRFRLCRSPPCSGPSRQSKTCNTHVCLGTSVWEALHYAQLSSGYPWDTCIYFSRAWRSNLETLLSMIAAHGTLPAWPVELFTRALSSGWGLSPWGPWSPCSLSCGGLGMKTRFRSCTQPAPAHGGRKCLGARQETTYCQAPDCPGNVSNHLQCC
uniref:Uncharacterized protein n=1 Tax=Neogobius melanostomus TaxID=47308 RepID=A0A8C6WKI5_9GOBI